MIQLSNLSFGYTKDRKIFDDLNLSFESGHIYGVLGPNGSGKSSLLNLISGLLFPQSGSLSVQGLSSQKRQPEMLQNLYYIIEEIYVPNMKALDWVARYGYAYPRFQASDYREYLKMFDIDLRQPADKMSMGQRKKICLAFALACHTPLLLLDEPTNGLDIASSAVFRKILARISAEDNCVLFASHHVRDMAQLIDQLLIFGPKNQLFMTSVEDVSRRFATISYNGNTPPAQSIYHETNLLGGRALIPNTEGRDANIDFELLYNAVVQGLISL